MHISFLSIDSFFTALMHLVRTSCPLSQIDGAIKLSMLASALLLRWSRYIHHTLAYIYHVSISSCPTRSPHSLRLPSGERRIDSKKKKKSYPTPISYTLICFWLSIATLVLHPLNENLVFTAAPTMSPSSKFCMTSFGGGLWGKAS